MNLSLQTLPPEIQKIVFDERNTEINDSIIAVHKIPPQQTAQILNILVSVITKEIAVLSFPIELAKIDLPNIDRTKLALDFALLRLWPLQDWLGNVDTLIQRLGGEVPAYKPKIDMDPTRAEEDVVQVTTAKKFLDGASKRRYYHITTSYIHDTAGKSVEPTIENWLKDYLHFSGEGAADSLSRSQYLVKSPNVAALQEDEKENLLNFLLSYGQDTDMRFSVDDGAVAVASVENAVTEKSGSGPASPAELDEIIQSYKEEVAEFHSVVDKQIVAFQLDGQSVAKLADIIWNALGLVEVDRAQAAVYVLAAKGMLGAVISEDSRFTGIIRRYVNVRFGNQAKSAWQPKPVNTTFWIIFFSMLFQDKLQLTGKEAAVRTLYLSQIMKLQQKPVYIDMASGSFHFRNVVYRDNQFTIEA